MNVVDFIVGDPTKVAIAWTVAVVPEGYTQAELAAGLFDTDVAALVARLLVTPPFSHRDLRPLLNVVKVRKASANTGNKIKLLTPAPAVSPFGTAFGAMFGRDMFNGKQIKRSLYGDSAAVKQFVRSQPGLASVNHFLVIVNNTEIDGGTTTSGVGWFSKESKAWPDVALHELAHQAFDLADEYAYRNGFSDPVSAYTGSERSEPNVTIVTDVTRVKWADLLTLPQAQVPTTVKSTPCVRDHPVIPTSPPIPPDAVGAYEGAAYADCGIFRPCLQCKMRESGRPFCRVCEMVARSNIGHYLLKQGLGTTTDAGAWTHMQGFLSSSNPPRTLAYCAITGTYAISDTERYFLSPRRPDGTPPLVTSNPSLGTGSIGPDWTWLVPFSLNGTLNYLGHQFGSGQQGIFAMNATGTSLSLTHITPPGHASHTHVVTLTLNGLPHYIGYNSLTGDASLFRTDSDVADPRFVATMQWGAGHTSVVSVPINGEPFILTYRLPTGEVMIRRIAPSGFTMAFASPSNFWTRNITHVALMDLSGRPYVVRYSGLDGHASIYHVRSAGAGIDFVCRISPTPGVGGLSLLGVGAPAVGTLTIPSAGGGSSEHFYFYSALHKTLTLLPLSVR